MNNSDQNKAAKKMFPGQILGKTSRSAFKAGWNARDAEVEALKAKVKELESNEDRWPYWRKRASDLQADWTIVCNMRDWWREMAKRMSRHLYDQGYFADKNAGDFNAWLADFETMKEEYNSDGVDVEYPSKRVK